MHPLDSSVQTPAPATESVTPTPWFALLRRCSCPKETWIAIIAGVGIVAYLLSRYVAALGLGISNWILIAVLVIGGVPLLIDLVRKAFRGEFGSDILAGLSIVTSAILGEYLAGSIVVLMLSGGTALEQFASRRASAVLAALAKRLPSVAHKHTGSEIIDISLEEVQVGDHLTVFPHEICPADGVIVEGRGTMDESYLTGEPYLISKTVGAAVLSGALNGESAFIISATRLPKDSRYARIMQVMREAEMKRPRLRRIADRLGAWYTVLAIAIAIAGWIAGHDATRFLAVLVIATPCPLLLGIPVAIIGAISVAGGRGIIVKNPAMLERVSRRRTMIFDKTGTLTYGKPALTNIIPAPGLAVSDVIRMAASVEQYSRHPLAEAILKRAKDENIAMAPVTEISERPGEGLTANVGGALVHITGRNKLQRRDPALVSELPPVAPGMECILLLNGRHAATFQFRDAPRAETRSFVRHLVPEHDVNRILLLSGDREAEVRYLGKEIGISEALFAKNPEEKVAIVKEEASRGPTLFVGDGINDAPAMQAATVGIAFGQNSDITAEAADAVVLEPSLIKVDELIHLGRRMRRIALQSAVGGMALSLMGMLIAAAGYLPPVAGAVAQEVIDLAAVLNALRVALPSGELRPD